MIRLSLWGLLLAIPLFFALKSNHNNNSLRERGLPIKAKIIDIYRTGRKGTINIEYEFKINNIYRGTYFGSIEDKIGDTIIVVYLPENPSINKPKEALE